MPLNPNQTFLPLDYDAGVGIGQWLVLTAAGCCCCQADFKLMMQNCMQYNRPDTVYHREAKRLLNVGLKHLSRVSESTHTAILFSDDHVSQHLAVRFVYFDKWPDVALEIG